MSCEYESACLNSSKCFRCYDQSLLKLKHEKRKSYASQSTQKDRAKKDSWKSLEQDVTNKLNRIPTITEARRSIASGALWFEKGDIVDDILHPECKERTAKELKSGEHSMSIKREWLEKAKEECIHNNKTMCLPFRFKEDENIYCIFDMNDIAALVTTMKSYIQDNELKELEIKRLQSIIERSKQNE